jgi:hypothetical protein
MVMIKPTYYPDTKTWETESGMVAETLRSLSEQLPSGTKIADYYPHGVTVNRKAWPDNTEGGKKFRSELRTSYGKPSRQREAARINNELEARLIAEKARAEKEARALIAAAPKPRGKPGVKRTYVDTELVLELRSRFQSIEKIALALDCGPDVVRRCIKEAWAAGDMRARVTAKRESSRYPNGRPWDENKLAELRRLVKLGLTSGEIAAAMGITRNMVISQVKHQGLVLRGSRRLYPVFAKEKANV